MPERFPLYPFIPPLRREIQATSYPVDAVDNLTKEVRECVIGYGGNKIAVKHPSDEKKVVSIFYRDLPPLQAKKHYYLGRILETLFPHNFPHIYAVHSGKDELCPPIQVSELIVKDADSNTYERSHKSDENQTRRMYRISAQVKGKKPLQHPFSEVRKTCEKIGLPFYFEWNYDNNFIIQDGGEYYIDSVICDKINELYLQAEKIYAHMRKKAYSEADIEKVKLSINRLAKLQSEEDARQSSRSPSQMPPA